MRKPQTLVGLACLAISATSMAASSHTHIGLTNISGATYINHTRYTTSGTGTNIGLDMAINRQLGLILGYGSAKVNSSISVNYTDLGVRYRLDETTSTYFSANRAAVAGNSETLFMLGAKYRMRVGSASEMVLKAGSSTSNLFDDWEFSVNYSLPIIDVLNLNFGYQSKVSSLGKSSTTATSSGYSLSISSRF